MRREFKALSHADLADHEILLKKELDAMPDTHPSKKGLKRLQNFLLDLLAACEEAQEIVLDVLGTSEFGSDAFDMEYGYWKEEDVLGRSGGEVEAFDDGSKGDAAYLSDLTLAMLNGTYVFPEDEEIVAGAAPNDPPFMVG